MSDSSIRGGSTWPAADRAKTLTPSEWLGHYFDRNGWPESGVDRDGFIRELHKLKTDLYMQIIESGELPLRSGVARLVDEAIAAGVDLAVCSTSNERAALCSCTSTITPVRLSFGDLVIW